MTYSRSVMYIQPSGEPPPPTNESMSSGEHSTNASSSQALVRQPRTASPGPEPHRPTPSLASKPSTPSQPSKPSSSEFSFDYQSPFARTRVLQQNERYISSHHPSLQPQHPDPPSQGSSQCSKSSHSGSVSTKPPSLHQKHHAITPRLPTHVMIPSISTANGYESDQTFASSIQSFGLQLSSPPCNDFISFLDWINDNMLELVPTTFQQFLVEDLEILSFAALSEFLEVFDGAHYLNLLGHTWYDHWRKYLVNIKVILTFINRFLASPASIMAYSTFLTY